MTTDDPSRSSGRRLALQVALGILALVFLAPFLSLISTSVRNDRHAAAHPSEILPRAEYVKRPGGEWREVLQTADLSAQGKPGQLRAEIGDWSGSVDKIVTVRTEEMVTRTRPTARNYSHGLMADHFARHSWNTLLLCVVGAAAATFSSALVAYAFSVLRWPGRDGVFYTALATLMLPAPLTMLPMHQLYHGFGLLQSYAPLILPSLFGNAFSIFLLRQFFLKIPRDIIEAARMEGSSDWGVFTGVVLPLSKPALSVVALLAFLWQWGDLIEPFTVLANGAKNTLSMALAELQLGFPARHGELMAMSAVLTVPLAVLVLLIRKTLARGVRLLLPTKSSP